MLRGKPDYSRKLHDKAISEKRQMAIERRGSAGSAAGTGGEGDAAGAGGGEVPQVRVITLNHGEHQDSTLYLFEKGMYVQFVPGPSLLGRRVFLYTNYVVTENQDEKCAGAAEFVRNQYYGLEWERVELGPGVGDGAGGGAGGGGGAGAGGGGGGWARGGARGAGALVTDEDLAATLLLRRAGAFHYYFVYETADSALGPAGSGWFQVAPRLQAGGATLPLDAVCCQTVLAKCLGPLPRWESVLRVAKESGYNMIHFSPIQELGASRSGYSIASQLTLNSSFSAGAARPYTFADVEALLTKMRHEWQMLSISDVVLNHTANETAWLRSHPEATYNCALCPHLRPAALLDAALAQLTRTPPAHLAHNMTLVAVRSALQACVLQLRLEEMYQCDVTDILNQYNAIANNRVASVGAASGTAAARELQLTADPLHRRFRATIDMDLALQLYNVHMAECSEEERLRRCSEALAARLRRLNEDAARELHGALREAVDNCVAGVQYERFQSDGPKITELNEKHPLVPRYFTFPVDVARCSLAELEAALWGERGALCQAHNGWLVDADPLQDFAHEQHGGRVYLRRQLIAWGDSVKLRYGSAPEDSPFLWAHMREYVQLTAELFDGLRLDNCHSTPVHVAEYMLDCARNVKPELYVVAELFTNSHHVDNIFVNRLGITALIREALSAWSAHEQGRQTHRFSPRAAGSLPRPARRPAHPAVARALLLDLTHDNPSPVHKRSVFDMCASAALVASAACASGSTRGYDELVPHHIHVVNEERLYPAWGEAGEVGEAGELRCGEGSGMVAAKRALNTLHQRLAREGYSEVYVDQMDADTVAVTRHHPRERKSVIIVALTAFSPPSPCGGGASPPPLRFEGQLDDILLETHIVHQDYLSTGRPLEGPGDAGEGRHARYVSGLRQYRVPCAQHVPRARSGVFASVQRDGNHTVLTWQSVRPGTVVVIQVSPWAEAQSALRTLSAQCEGVSSGRADPLGLGDVLRPLSLCDLNTVLYRCSAEEQEHGGDVYALPSGERLVYAGLQGVVSVLSAVEASDDLGHALCDNLRRGDWLPDYLWQRLKGDTLQPLADKFRALLSPLRSIPRFLVPCYFSALVRGMHAACAAASARRLGAAAARGSTRRGLLLAAVQLTARVPSAPLPRAPTAGSLSAGLPHFATGYMRCWGRDTFISLRGLLLLTHRYQEAKQHIVSFGACMRHGLIPNLLSGGEGARFNCRDAVWWWLRAVRQYCSAAPQGLALLGESVERLFPAHAGAAVVPLRDLVQETLDTHFQGLVFRERDAGRTIDAHMTDRGFDVQVGVDPDTGFPFGGNDANCGTWMDKMGSSERAGNRGKPATPRDGSAVELVALCHAALCWLHELHAAGGYPHAGVARRTRDGARVEWTWRAWAERIERNFERHFWVPGAASATDARPDLVHRRNIYKDTHGASQPWADYQLRCNYPVAMCISPRLFSARNAWAALDTVERLLLGPLGVKTLDPADWAYRGDYDNSNDSDDPSVAHGFNYHQGPEWVWPIGFYIRARLLFAQENGSHARALSGGYRALAGLVQELHAGPWRGLPELTNAGGAHCRDSCRTQAWSAATVLEALHDLEEAGRARPLAAD